MGVNTTDANYTIERGDLPGRIRGILIQELEELTIALDVDEMEQHEIVRLMKSNINKPALKFGGFTILVVIRQS
jgi:hypothetical protein